MKPVDQIVFEEGKGDCLRACVASIVEWPVEAVPNFAEDDSYVFGAIKWLKERGYSSLRIDFSGDGYDHSQYISSTFDPNIYCILGGVSPRTTPEKKRQHAVVGRAFGWGFKIEHDPHPSRAGLVGEPNFALWIFRHVPVPHRMVSPPHEAKTRELYERLIEPLRAVAKHHGYALAVHGSLERDIDLIAAPWIAREATSEPRVLAEAIRDEAARLNNGIAFMHHLESGEYFEDGCPGMKPHGRLAWSYHLGGGPYIDLSVMPPERLTPETYDSPNSSTQAIGQTSKAD